MRRRAARLVLGLAAIGCSMCARETQEVEAPEAPKSVHCVAIKSLPLDETIELRGTIAPLPDRDAQVAAQVAGRILRVLVREGDRVKAGQTLAQIDSQPLLDLVHEAEAASARASAERKNAATTLTRLQRVFEHGIAARQEVDDAVAHAAVAEANEAEAAAVTRRAQLQLQRATVQSPLEGVVLRIMKRSGELVDGTPASAIVEVGDPAQLELVADVPAQDIVRIARGNATSISMSALPGVTYQGHVSALAPAVDRATGLGMVRVALHPNQPSAPPIGAYGNAQVRTGNVRNALFVPIDALRHMVGNEAELVGCGADNLAHVRRVTRGELRAGLVEIVAGIQLNERVVLDPVLGVEDGERLKVLP